jgi:hypothetical protein
MALGAPLEERRAYACRLTRERALHDLDEAAAFLADRGMLTRTADSALPSLFGAIDEPPYRDGGRGFASWPRFSWRWSFALATRPGVLVLRIHRGRDVYLAGNAIDAVDPLCRAELARAEQGAEGPEAAALVSHLAATGPSLTGDLRDELGLGTAALRRLRTRLESRGALVSRAVELEDAGGHGPTLSEIRRYDQAVTEPREGGLGALLAAGVHAAVAAPEAEARRWFAWAVPADVVDELVAAGTLTRPAAGWLAVP